MMIGGDGEQTDAPEETPAKVVETPAATEAAPASEPAAATAE